MGRIKTLLTQVKVDYAKKAHNCQADATHRLQKSDKRLKVKKGMGWDHYCWSCAMKIFAKDIEELNKLKSSS